MWCAMDGLPLKAPSASQTSHSERTQPRGQQWSGAVCCLFPNVSHACLSRQASIKPRMLARNPRDIARGKKQPPRMIPLARRLEGC